MVSKKRRTTNLIRVSFSSGSAPEKVVKAKIPEDLAETVGKAETGAWDIKISEEVYQDVLDERAKALSRVYNTLDQISVDLKQFFPNVPEVLPVRITGQLINPDGSPARALAVEALKPKYGKDENVGDFNWPVPRDITDVRGAFGLTLPTAPMPAAGLHLQAIGSNGKSEIQLERVDVIDGKLGIIPLKATLTPLAGSVLSQLKEIIPTGASDSEDNPGNFADPAPVINLGEGDCSHSFRSNSGVIDQFSYSILIRLIEPRVTPKQLILNPRGQPYPLLFSSLVGELSDYADPATAGNALVRLGKFRLVDRIPVDEPIDVAGFHSALDADTKNVPKASSLGIGYVVKMQQIWIPAGLSLGDLLYSLPLAPGEVQRVAVVDKSETLSVREAETFNIEEAQRSQENLDSSTSAIFNSAYNESARGHSDVSSDASSWSIGGATGAVGLVYGVLMGGGVAGGYGSSSSSGNANSWQTGSRDYVSNASQDLHSQISRRANASRQTNRTGIRLATATDIETVTTKVIANHNHCHALTIQYWEVLRHYAISTKVNDVQLVCFIPLEIIQFHQPGQPATLPDLPTSVPGQPGTPPTPPPGQSQVFTRSNLLNRYAMLIRYHDVLSAQMRWRADYAHGMALLNNFAADPTATVQASAFGQQDSVSITLKGTFLPFENVYASLVTKNGVRIGQVRLEGASTALPTNLSSRAELLQTLRDRRNSTTGETRQASIILPDYIARTDIARLELSRSFQAFNYHLDITLPASITFGFNDFYNSLIQSNVTLSPSDLERELGGPWIWDVRAAIQGAGGPTVVDAYQGRGSADRMSTTEPVPTLRVPPILRFSDLLRIEAVYQHVVRNAVAYSKAVWVALTPEERVILLERYTIGVPQGGLQDPTQEVPLLNCVANQVLGFYGNSMIMPFFIPPQVAEKMKVTSRDVQEALLRFHRQSFVPPRSAITLPTRGVLGEAVLGSCNSCEKIDLTRFWNWSDSRGEDVTQITPSEFRGQSLIGSEGAKAPQSLVPTAPQTLLNINSGTAAPGTPSDIIDKLIASQPKETGIKDITGMDTLKEIQKQTLTNAESARKEAIDKASDTFKTLIDKYPDAIKAKNAVDDETKKRRDDEKASQEKAAKEAADQKSASQKEGLTKLGSNATGNIGVAGLQPNDADALKKAQDILSGLFSSGMPALADLASVYDNYKIDAAKDDPATVRGKTAFLKAFGFIK